MPIFSTEHLSLEGVAEACALVRMAAPDIGLKDWMAHVEALFLGGGGVLVIRAGDGAMHGLATYRPDHVLRHGFVLRVETFVTMELSRHAPVRRALCDALEALGEAMGCAALLLTLPSRGYADPAGPKAAPWQALGQKLESVTFVRPLGSRTEEGRSAAQG